MEDYLDKVLPLPFLQHIEPTAKVLEWELGQALVEVRAVENLERLVVEFDFQEETNIVAKDFEFAVVTYLSYY